MSHVAAISGESIQRWLRATQSVGSHGIAPNGMTQLVAGFAAAMHFLNRTAAMGVTLYPLVVDYVRYMMEHVVQLEEAILMGDFDFIDEHSVSISSRMELSEVLSSPS